MLESMQIIVLQIVIYAFDADPGAYGPCDYESLSGLPRTAKDTSQFMDSPLVPCSDAGVRQGHASAVETDTWAGIKGGPR